MVLTNKQNRNTCSVKLDRGEFPTIDCNPKNYHSHTENLGARPFELSHDSIGKPTQCVPMTVLVAY